MPSYVESMSGMSKTKRRDLIRGTMKFLSARIAARKAGARLGFVDSSFWLIDMAINRRAGWPDDPSSSRGSCRPGADGKYPKDAQGDTYNHLRLLANKINTPRVIVRYAELGEWRALIMANIPNRITMPGEDF